MANAFNMLRPNDLIWPYVVNVYMKGKAPFPFDLLYWNSDSTRMPAANHAFYLRNCYLENKLTKGEMEVGGVKLDPQEVKIPIFNLAAGRTTSPGPLGVHGSKAFGGPVDYVVAGSGHHRRRREPGEQGESTVLDRGPVKGDLRRLARQGRGASGTWWPYWFTWIE
jgi:polyhydroxyalkanoate synthase